MKSKRIVLVILVVIGVLVAVKFLFPTSSKKEKSEVIDSISGYPYELKDRDTDLVKKEFKHLKEILSQKEVNEEDYAKSVAILFASDFYHLDNKVTNQDIGGVSYLQEDMRENFCLKASDTMYKYVENDIYNSRGQILPKVVNVEVEDISNTAFEEESIKDSKAYLVTLKITYQQDLGYPTKVKITLVHEENKLSIVKVD